MEETPKNKMAEVPMKKLFWKMGMPMIISMVLQALYNVVDSIFVTNMVWWTFPIAEILTCIISAVILKKTYKEKIAILVKNKD